ncbi:hypothetical protein BDV26DRAFT_252871 [Aspergillus bertholletiae]|uniref:Uncharacterized protein n=1 Tax=Aspergillus bertholletiae TaxID=1226010 RepID=A0A5N7BMF8_9EURO|nr:hypothetical protein BDV26DRAFT_252871 [Aspergillus bertholletiae]
MAQESHHSLPSNCSRFNEINDHDNNQESPTTNPQSPVSAAEYVDYYSGFLNQLLDLIRNEDQETVAQIVGLIRSGASQEDILVAIQSANTWCEKRKYSSI